MNAPYVLDFIIRYIKHMPVLNIRRTLQVFVEVVQRNQPPMSVPPVPGTFRLQIFLTGDSVHVMK